MVVGVLFGPEPEPGPRTGTGAQNREPEPHPEPRTGAEAAMEPRRPWVHSSSAAGVKPKASFVEGRRHKTKGRAYFAGAESSRKGQSEGDTAE